MRKYKTVDVIIPTYKPNQELHQLLDLLEQQSYPIEHIMILNTEEANWDLGYEKDRPKLEVFHIKKSEFDHGGTRQKGASMSLADILVFITQDALPDDEYLIENLVDAFDQEEVKAAYARQLPRKECDPIERYTRAFNYPAKSRIKSINDLEELGIKTFFCSNVCAAYDRKTYEALGGFEHKTIFNEDMIFAGNLIKAGYCVAYVAEAAVIHSHNLNSMEQFHRNFDMAVSQKEHPEVFEGVRSIGEGIKLVKKTAAYLLNKGKWYYLFPLFTRSAGKFLGYSLGKRFNKLPKKVVVWCSMNKDYWK